jgi:hypothetical protein
MRVHVSGPSLGHIHTTLWSSGRRKRTRSTAGLWVFTILAVSIWAYETSPVLGAGSTIIFAAIAAYKARRAWREL